MGATNRLYLDNNYAGNVSLFQVYQILFWLRTGYKVYNHSSKVPVNDRQYIITHFNMVYDKKKRRYGQSTDIIFGIFKDDFSEVFQKKKITEYNQLIYLAT